MWLFREIELEVVRRVSELQEGKPGDQALLGGNQSTPGEIGDSGKTSKGRRDRAWPSWGAVNTVQTPTLQLEGLGPNHMPVTKQAV